MAFQIILVVESDERSRSDIIYIRSVLDRYYGFRKLNDVKISEVFMAGKGNYNKRRVTNPIANMIKQYRSIGETIVIYCFDTDRYDSDSNDKRLFDDHKKYCYDNGYEFVWFCHDIEEVFLGKSVAKSEKGDKAIQYTTKSGIEDIRMDRLTADEVAKGRSNLMLVLDKYLTRQGVSR